MLWWVVLLVALDLWDCSEASNVMRGQFTEDFERVLLDACVNNQQAMEWTQMYCLWAHFIDDVVDEEGWMTSENIMRSNIMIMNLTVHPWFYEHRAELFHIVQLTAALWQQSNVWDKQSQPWQKLEAEWMRCSGNLLVLVVANICGGYELMRKVTPRLAELSYKNQKQENA